MSTKAKNFFLVAVLLAVLISLLLVGYPQPKKRDNLSQKPNPIDWKAEMKMKRVNTFVLPAMRASGIDMWVVLSRENNPDPIAADLGAGSVVGRTACIFVDTGDSLRKISIAASYDITPIKDSDIYHEVISYKSEGLLPHLREWVTRFDPKKIGVNISRDEPIADGLSVSTLEYLKEVVGPQLWERIVSAEDIVFSLRGRKLPEEIELIRKAVLLTEEILESTLSPQVVIPGTTTEADVAEFIRTKMKEHGVEPSWEAEQCPSVIAGVGRGHSGPTDFIIQRGCLVRIDFGIKMKGYCTDVQRTAYVLKEGENEPPAEIMKLWETVVRANEAAVRRMKPGVLGNEVDTVARQVITQAGYEEYPHATGHPIGFSVHGVGPMLGPDWPHRYGKLVFKRLEEGQVFAVEPSASIFSPELGGEMGIGFEEDVVVLKDRAEYLGKHQTKLILIK